MPLIVRTLFEAMLALCPPGLRREYGAEMRADFARVFVDERVVHGSLGALAYALRATYDLFTTALREYAAMLYRDFVYALRALRRTPLFAAIVIATLALAIGANAAVFSIMRAVVLAPLPYPDPGRLVALNSIDEGVFSLPDFADIVRHDDTVIASAAAFKGDDATMTGHGTPRMLTGILATPGLFETLDFRPLLGRFPAANDTGHGAAKTVVLSETLWRQSFDADPHVLGTIVRLDGDAFSVIGVAPSNFDQPAVYHGFEVAQFWTFVPIDGEGTTFDRGTRSFKALARLRPGVSLAQLGAATNAAVAVMRKRAPIDDRRLGVTVESLTDSLVGSTRSVLFALFAAVGAVLLIACANVANLLLSRAASRDRELSVRMAIGASRSRIVAQLLVETFVLAFAGGVLGILIAYGTINAFLAFHPNNVPRADTVSLDLVSVLYTFCVVGLCTLAAGLAPAFASAGRDVGVALKNAGRGGDAHRGARARSALIMTEIALTLALVVAAGLVIRSFIALTSQPLGFDPAHVDIVGVVDFSSRRYAEPSYTSGFMERVVARTRTIPGVRSVAWGSTFPVGNQTIVSPLTIPGRSFPLSSEPGTAFMVIGSDYFTVLQIPMRAGRTFTKDDTAGAQPIAIVNEAFARKFFPGRSALGERVTPTIAPVGPPPVRTIVGVVSDTRRSLLAPAEATIYLPTQQMPFPYYFYLLVRGAPGSSPGPAVAATIATLDPLFAKPNVTTLPSRLAASVEVQRLTVATLAALAFVALGLAIAGVFAVVSYGVTQRTHEFGVRMALGAEARQIVRMVLGGAMRLAFAGIVLGLLVAGAGTRLLSGQLFDTQPLDALTFGIVIVIVLVAALVAALIPACRATRVDPMVALRYE